MTVGQVARVHYVAQQQLARRTAAAAAQAWTEVDAGRIAESWAGTLPKVVATVAAAQAAAASRADGYTDEVLAGRGVVTGQVARVNPRALSGVAADGRPLAGLLYQPAVTTLTAVARGASPDDALLVGRRQLAMIVATQVSDAGRVADGVAVTARRHVTGYVRYLSPPSCSRCAVLAGRRYGWSAGFQRHPRLPV